ncbi:hypothetical protein JCGZ_07879 [Jatropha curcas]|uniref:Uncharacterized protein n=1 Tax=Jatropha curcas TaxID=180498 RepID=A0A067KK90_JATCU|nr:hypothetical protein JCGZ_07879 [Jatropha curcas]
MARGRAFDLDASGTGSRGGRGSGCSACGRGGTIPPSSSGDMGELAKAWEDPAFKRKQEIFAQNKHSETSGDGAGPSRHIGGSISAIETARLLAEKLGRNPTPIEVFTYTHTKDHDLNTFVDRCGECESREGLVSSRTDESEAESRIDEVALYLEAVGGEKKRKVYNIGSQQSQFYCGSASHASAPSVGPQPEHTAEEFTELRAHQQPLPSPDPDAADNTLVTALGTIAHPAGTPSGDSTSDRADEQPRRFDFGPF